ncbi:hypothetical protein ACFE04_028537 [Oxalis oulophora]
MESVPKINHVPLVKSMNVSPFAVLSKHLHSLLWETLSFLCVILIASIEAYFIMQKWNLIFHFLFILSVFVLKRYFSRPASVYLVDFSCFKPPSLCRIPFSYFVENISLYGNFDKESVAFMAKILDSAGLSEETCLPPALHYIPPKTHQTESIKEAQMVLFPVMEDLLSKTKISATDIDILIINCCVFSPSPSLSSIIVNKFSMRSDVKSYNLSGMGCSASAIAVDLAQNLLKVHKNSTAIILSTEVLTAGLYTGNDKSKMPITPREEDATGNVGVTFKKDLLQAVGETLRSNIAIIGKRMLPLTEKLRHGVSVLRKKLIDKSEEIYMPNFKTVVQHFCLPTSGKPLIREIGRGFKLNERDMEAALMTLKRFGNQSSSSLWYELAYIEAKGRVKKGDRVWLVGLGTGLKCNSAIWECVRPIVGESIVGPWADCIDRYPTMD